MIENLDPYIYPGTNVLRNRRGLRDPEKLERFEVRATAHRLRERRVQPDAVNFDANRLRAIHGYIFQDVFAWAGQFRTVFLSKQSCLGGPQTSFAAPQLLEREAQDIASTIDRAGRLQGLSRDEFGRQAAGIFARLNQLHPFREGNGRTQREFIRELALQAGHPLSFDVVTKERMIAASIQASAGNLETMERLFFEISDELHVEILRETIEFLSGLSNFHWNDRYLAVTTAGQRYEGRLVGRQGRQCLMVDTVGRLLVSRVEDLPKSAKNGEPVWFVAAGF